ncbi:MAG: hypothetical protein Fur0043_09490 [Anaerolineales bacterium]
MKTKLFALFSLWVMALALLSACGGAATEIPVSIEAPAATEAPPEEGLRMGFAPQAPSAGPALGGNESQQHLQPIPTAGVIYQTVPDVGNAPGQPASISRMIVKNAEVSVLVEDSDVAIDRLTQIVSDVGGYIVSSRIWFQEYYGENYKYASITMGVPVGQFEVSLRRIRDLSIRVLDETASGEDVTDQFVDLESRLRNLEATQERIKSFLDDAKTVDEALRINQELAAVEAQIEEVKGRMNYLDDRSAFSTITVAISPQLPDIEPATPTPTPTPAPWNPGDTLEDATHTLVSAYQGIVEFAIWLFVAVLPVIAPPVLLVWLVVKAVRRRPNKTV